jgi:hypothetical protein
MEILNKIKLTNSHKNKQKIGLKINLEKINFILLIKLVF